MQFELFDLKSMTEIDYRMIFEVRGILIQSLWRLDCLRMMVNLAA